MPGQRIRKLLLLISLLLFPVTLYYFSPALIINAGLKGIINGSFVVFALLFLLSVPFGRLFCSYVCPAGGLQECAFSVSEKTPKQGWRNYIKFVLWTVWLTAVVLCYFHSGKIAAVDVLFETKNGISVSSMQSYVIYYGIICLVLLPSLLCGKRAFCHYFCWMAPFMITGMALRRRLHLPGIQIRADSHESCISCGSCNRACPMSVDVMREIKHGSVQSDECIQCGACIDRCPKHVLSYGLTSRKEACDGK